MRATGTAHAVREDFKNNKLVGARLIQYLPIPAPLVRPPPGAIAAELGLRDAVSDTDLLRRCTTFQPNLFSSFGGDTTRTDRQTDRQTDSKLRSASREKLAKNI